MYSYFLRVVVYQIDKKGIGAPSDSGTGSLLAIAGTQRSSGDRGPQQLRQAGGQAIRSGVSAGTQSSIFIVVKIENFLLRASPDPPNPCRRKRHLISVQQLQENIHEIPQNRIAYSSHRE